MTNEKKFYLREDVYFEPLWCQWYAWPYLLPPVTGARHMVNTHRRIMKSFIKNYKLHIMAVKQPGMAGAEFLDCTEEQVDDIKKLVDKIDNEYSDMVELADAVREVDELCRNHTSGESTDALYEQVPGPLQGYVEFFMDMEHNASYRLLESLLYRSQYYKPELQSVSFGLLDKVGERPFVLSTPRLPDDNHIQFKVGYADPMLDTLFAARMTPLSQAEVEALFAGRETAGGVHYSELFTEKAPEHVYEPTDKVRMEYIGHAGFMIDTPEVTVLIDPVIASRGEQNADEVISFTQLPDKIDYICITHSHQDHANLESLLQLRHKTDTILVPKNNGGQLPDPSLKMLLQQFNFKVIELDDLDEIPVPGGKIVSVPFLGEHGDLNVRSKAAWFLELEGKKLFFGADSSNLDPHMYEHISKVLGKIDVMAIGMECVGAPYTWLYGALHTKMVSKKIKESRRLNGSDSVQAFNIAKIFDPDKIFLYALGLEPWYKYFMGLDYDENSVQLIETDKMIDLCKEHLGVETERLYGKRRYEP
ncbi:MBL fold metallo-hydrolase [Pseudoalteromonas sp. SMS1]|uniref:MBL fold metallo-hydrolase n=1 Tax=Pseudoalteromonas sp. SMS1 TaxID=2908894 RepID=UPI001F3C9753|nr:MBL fold metallo-hydrolase [Pseudoalteromonas sp. SMS1]MCF2856177.1 MBL fold metallo-hydrolase [Pseudoalteromonas sp. SMS1]